MGYVSNSRANVTKASGAPAAVSDLLPPVRITVAWIVGQGAKARTFVATKHVHYKR